MNSGILEHGLDKKPLRCRRWFMTMTLFKSKQHKLSMLERVMLQKYDPKKQMKSLYRYYSIDLSNYNWVSLSPVLRAHLLKCHHKFETHRHEKAFPPIEESCGVVSLGHLAKLTFIQARQTIYRLCSTTFQQFIHRVSIFPNNGGHNRLRSTSLDCEHDWPC